jgi:hypothetical protein
LTWFSPAVVCNSLFDVTQRRDVTNSQDVHAVGPMNNISSYNRKNR